MEIEKYPLCKTLLQDVAKECGTSSTLLSERIKHGMYLDVMAECCGYHKDGASHGVLAMIPPNMLMKYVRCFNSP